MILLFRPLNSEDSIQKCFKERRALKVSSFTNAKLCPEWYYKLFIPTDTLDEVKMNTACAEEGFQLIHPIFREIFKWNADILKTKKKAYAWSSVAWYSRNVTDRDEFRRKIRSRICYGTNCQIESSLWQEQYQTCNSRLILSIHRTNPNFCIKVYAKCATTVKHLSSIIILFAFFVVISRVSHVARSILPSKAWRVFQRRRSGIFLVNHVLKQNDFENLTKNREIVCFQLVWFQSMPFIIYTKYSNMLWRFSSYAYYISYQFYESYHR